MCNYLYCSRPMVVQQVFTIYRWLSHMWIRTLTPQDYLPKNKEKIWLLLLAKHWSLNTYLLRMTYYYIEHSYQHYYLNKGQLISEELILVWLFYNFLL